MRILLYVIVSLVVLNIVQGLVVPDQFDIRYRIGDRGQGSIPVTYINTTHNFTIFNVTVEGIPHLNFTSIPTMVVNDTFPLNYTYRITSPVQGNFDGTVIFFYKSNVTKEPENVTVLVNDTFTPINTTVRVNDSIIYKNVDTINRTVTNLLNPDDRTVIQPGQTYRRTFTEKSNFTFFDEVDGFGSFVRVLTNQVPAIVHTPSLDQQIRGTFSFASDSISYQLIPETFTMDFNGRDEGVLRLQTNETIFGLTLTGDWFSFSHNKFQLNGTTLVTFTVRPAGIDRTDETNIVYNKTVTVSGTNLEPFTVTVPIRINQFNFSTVEEDIRLVLRPMTIAEQRQYCEEVDWEDPTCEKYIRNESYPVFRERVIRPNLNESDFIEFIDSPDKIIESNNRLLNKLETTESQQNERIGSLQTQINSLQSNIEQLSPQIKTINDYVVDINDNNSATSALIWIIIMIIVTVTVSYRFIVWLKSRKKITTGFNL